MSAYLKFPQDKKEIAALAASRRVIFFAAPIQISPARFRELLKFIPRGFQPVFGFYRDKKIANLAGPVLAAQTDWSAFTFPPRAVIVSYREQAGAQLVSILRARRLVFVHGSGSSALYLREIWHAAFRARRDLSVREVKLVSPYTQAEAARHNPRLGKGVRTRRATASDRKLMAAVASLAASSLCWVRQRGALAIRGHKILVRAFNRIWPAEYYCLATGCRREAELIPSGQQLERCFAAHAETGVISAAARQGIKLDQATMYTTTFPCINCAKVIVGSGIKEVVFWEDYANRDGELILRGAGIKLTKLKI